ncbi:bleomycin hydrolase [Puccinia graminis f. sp. tritici CRL 75-36-700-3]|uniref:Cysteine proteinase 1, mitochondrial n=1 Tax=Puccinia graminis f. sp. tritici (strain CRL 75-36-700-3 / race SCCL) TaxID=418459 RepID=E3KWK5_PUCGT|nr:bleomycin hydrolase [Puccinia graminis f. sp. tritici CRL 75-36-700-3]EFP88672.1 bleomycin hydrolase [Puccinia graminis f. sp. tritici CRL 75-36-700-3]
MGSQASKVTSKTSPAMVTNNGKPYSSTEEKSQARADAASTAALLSRLHLSQSTLDRRQLTKMIEPSSHEGHPPASEISLDTFARWQNAFERNDKAHFASTVLSKQNLNTALLSRQALAADKQVFSHTLSVQPTPVTNQKSSGRCWLFATCNVLRVGIVKKFNLGDFELSQSYLFFYDTLEKANYYLESMIELADEPIDARIVSHLSSSPEGDGGQWDMVVGLIEKYGVVPKAIYDESFHSSNSGGLKTLLTSKLRDFALELRQVHEDAVHHAVNVLGKDFHAAKALAVLEARKAKETMMAKVYQCLAIAFGTPPSATSTFTWEYLDVNGKAHSLTSTPLDFYHNHCSGFKASEYISLINDPRHDYLQSYTVNRLGNVWGGRAVRYVNTTSETLKELVIKMIKADRPVWFGCDVGKMSTSTYGIMDTELFDYESAFGIAPHLSKSERLQTGDSAMTHAMVITAVHLDGEGNPVRFKVENSWSDTAGDHGYFMMTNAWFDEFVYQIVIPKLVVPSELKKVYEEAQPLVLPAWDPMGSLA